MQALSEKFMSDEETDTENQDSLVKRTPIWRSEDVNKLLKKLDLRYSRNKKCSRPSKPRQIGPPSTRSKPSSAPRWAMQAPHAHSDADLGNEDDLSGSEPEVSVNPNELQADSGSDAEMDSWIHAVTGV